MNILFESPVQENTKLVSTLKKIYLHKKKKRIENRKYRFNTFKPLVYYEKGKIKYYDCNKLVSKRVTSACMLTGCS